MKIRDLFFAPKPADIAKRDLIDHKRDLVKAKQQLSSARSAVQHHMDCIAELDKLVVNLDESNE